MAPKKTKQETQVVVPVESPKVTESKKSKKNKDVKEETQDVVPVETLKVTESKKSKKNKDVKQETQDVVDVPVKVSKKNTKSAKTDTEVVEGGDGEAAASKKTEKKHRSFKAIYLNPSGEVVMEGRYCGGKPKQAACKALTGIHKLFKKNAVKLSGSVNFGVRETTRNSKNKLYWYNGDRLTLKNPVKLDLGIIDEKTGKAKEIIYKYNSIVKKASEEDCQHLLKYKCVDGEEDETKHVGGKKAVKKAVKKVVKKATKATKATKVSAKKSDKGKTKAVKTVKVAKKE
jgi:hypothetical protein